MYIKKKKKRRRRVKRGSCRWTCADKWKTFFLAAVEEAAEAVASGGAGGSRYLKSLGSDWRVWPPPLTTPPLDALVLLAPFASAAVAIATADCGGDDKGGGRNDDGGGGEGVAAVAVVVVVTRIERDYTHTNIFLIYFVILIIMH